MKRFWAVLMAVALLVCLMLAVPAAAEELYTFAGLEWDTPFEECEAALEEGTGAGFTTFETEYSRYVIIDPGYYSVLGMPIETTGSTVTDGIMAYYEQLDDGAWTLTSVLCTSNTAPLDEEGFGLIGAVIDNAARKYGEPTLVALMGSDEGVIYLVPQEEFPYILRDSFAFAVAKDWDNLAMIVAFRNVCVLLDADLDDADSEYELMLGYVTHAVSVDSLGAQGDVTLMTFPWVNGAPEYFVIEP